MRLTVATSALMLATLFAAPVLAGTQKAIPAAFHGKWEGEIDDCANDESGTRIVVHANSISYFEEGDEVLAVTTDGPDTIHILVNYENYDGSERLNRTLTLSDQGETLTFSYPDGARYVNQRCPQGDPDGE